MGDFIMFIDDIDKDISDFKESIFSLNMQIGVYKEKCDPYFRKTFKDSNILKNDMKSAISKAVFMSSFGDNDE